MPACLAGFPFPAFPFAWPFFDSMRPPDKGAHHFVPQNRNERPGSALSPQLRSEKQEQTPWVNTESPTSFRKTGTNSPGQR